MYVGYVNIQNGLVSVFDVISGNIQWSDNSFFDSDSNSVNPTLLLRSETIIGITVAPEPTSLIMIVFGAICILGAARAKRRPDSRMDLFYSQYVASEFE